MAAAPSAGTKLACSATTGRASFGLAATIVPRCSDMPFPAALLPPLAPLPFSITSVTAPVASDASRPPAAAAPCCELVTDWDSAGAPFPSGRSVPTQILERRSHVVQQQASLPAGSDLWGADRATAQQSYPILMHEASMKCGRQHNRAYRPGAAAGLPGPAEHAHLAPCQP